MDTLQIIRWIEDQEAVRIVDLLDEGDIVVEEPLETVVPLDWRGDDGRGLCLEARFE